VGRLVREQQVCTDHTEAAARAVRAGNDIIMTNAQFFDGAQDAVERGFLTEAEIDTVVRRILTLKFELGLFEDTRRPDPARQAAVIGSPDHAALNLEVAHGSLVLLSNDGTLPYLDGAKTDASGRAVVPGEVTARHIP
jgi:beta-glucosidase